MDEPINPDEARQQLAVTRSILNDIARALSSREAKKELPSLPTSATPAPVPDVEMPTQPTPQPPSTSAPATIRTPAVAKPELPELPRSAFEALPPMPDRDPGDIPETPSVVTPAPPAIDAAPPFLPAPRAEALPSFPEASAVSMPTPTLPDIGPPSAMPTALLPEAASVVPHAVDLPSLPETRGAATTLPEMPAALDRFDELPGAPSAGSEPYQRASDGVASPPEQEGGSSQILEEIRDLLKALVDQKQAKAEPGPQADGSFVPSFGHQQQTPITPRALPPRTMPSLAEMGNGPWQLHVQRNRGG